MGKHEGVGKVGSGSAARLGGDHDQIMPNVKLGLKTEYSGWPPYGYNILL